MTIRIKVMRSILVMSMLPGLTQTGSAQTEIPMSTEKGTLTVIFSGFVRDFGDTVRLHASIRNDTSFKFRSVMFAMYGYDANGNDLWLCGDADNKRRRRL
jgi:hypothetical protein